MQVLPINYEGVICYCFLVEAYGLRGGGEPLVLLLLLLLPLAGLLGLRDDILRATLRGLGDPEDDDDLPRLVAGPRPLRGEIDLERDRAGLRIGGERLRLIGDLLGGLRARLGGGDRRLGGEPRLRVGGLPRNLLGEALTGDRRLGGGEPERPRDGDAGLLLGDVSPRR